MRFSGKEIFGDVWIKLKLPTLREHAFTVVIIGRTERLFLESFGLWRGNIPRAPKITVLSTTASLARH
jgi:hypothetical protein